MVPAFLKRAVRLIGLPGDSASLHGSDDLKMYLASALSNLLGAAATERSWKPFLKVFGPHGITFAVFEIQAAKSESGGCRVIVLLLLSDRLSDHQESQQ